MTDTPIQLDERRGMAAQRETEVRRLIAEVDADQKALRRRQEELETALASAPAATWHEAAVKARYLIMLLADSPIAQDPRRKTLIADVLADLTRLDEQTRPAAASSHGERSQNDGEGPEEK